MKHKRLYIVNPKSNECNDVKVFDNISKAYRYAIKWEKYGYLSVIGVYRLNGSFLRYLTKSPAVKPDILFDARILEGRLKQKIQDEPEGGLR